ncbi:uncharacterized protein VTP21DRAFT_1585 [Calcarisporiella thermophila]|uniref:uncharacterized protein n=1 Tax=Calcarisporiella thermophila TaxID=911321 RepID=UPI003744303B
MSSSKNTNPQKNNGVVLARVSGELVTYSHTLFAYCAFFIALIVGCYTHYYKIVENEFYGYPIEWFPSVSATIGDRYPARAIFQIFIALTSGPRFALVFLWYLISVRNKPGAHVWQKSLLIVGLLRTVACGGWVYVTSTDDHFLHDVAMITYLVLTLPWMVGGILSTPIELQRSLRMRKRLCYTFFGSLIPLVYLFIQHKVHHVPGAYTYYAFFEWSLILYDVAFDAATAFDFCQFELNIVDISGISSMPSSNQGAKKSSRLTPTPFAEIRGFVSEVYLSFVFWSMLTSLALLIWYFPLWHMGLSGYEAFLFITLSPMLLGINSLRRVVSSYRGFFHLISLISLASYKISDPTNRLTVAAIGLSISILTYTASWVDLKARSGRLERDAIAIVLGLILHNVVKLAWWANNPIWPIMHGPNGGRNGLGLALAVIACIDLIIRDSMVPSVRIASDKTRPKKHWLSASFGLGALLFALHSQLTDTSALMRWVVDGYPNTGPMPIPWAPLPIAAMVIGVMLSMNRRITTSWLWYLIGCAGSAILVLYSAWNAYFGALLLTIYLISITPAFIISASNYPPGRTFFTAMMWYNILCLAHVWVVAYAFVPLGEYLRERTWVVVLITMLSIGWGVYNAKSMPTPKTIQLNVSKSVRRYARVVSIILLLLSGGITMMRVSMAKTPAPYHPENKSFTAGIWTIHFALDDDMWASEVRMRDVIKELEVDVIGLLESDTMRIIMGNRDHTQFLSEDLGMYVDYGPATSKHTWGCAMLSKFPIINSTHYLLPSPKGELACAIHATLDVYGQPVDFIVSHNGQEEDLLDRQLQTRELSRIMRESPNPFVFLGYVVTKPFGELYQTMVNDGKVHDIDTSDSWDRWCEYIFYRGLKRTGYARVSHGKITDTEIQLGKFQVLDNPHTWEGPSYNRIEEKDVPNELRFPKQFYPPGVRGHRYHVFDEPRYFN